MRSDQLDGLRQDGERLSWQRQYIRNALATLGHIDTEDRELAGYILDAEQALRKAGFLLDKKIKNSNPAQ